MMAQEETRGWLSGVNPISPYLPLVPVTGQGAEPAV